MKLELKLNKYQDQYQDPVTSEKNKYYNYHNLKVKFSLRCPYCNYSKSNNILFDDETFRICCNKKCNREFRAYIISRKLMTIYNMEERLKSLGM